VVGAFLKDDPQPEGATLLFAVVVVTIIVLVFWLIGAVIGWTWRWARRRWSA
jgi:hypothetical protein